MFPRLVDLEVLHMHVRPHVGPPLREVPRGLEDPLGSDRSLVNDVNRWHHPILVCKPQSGVTERNRSQPEAAQSPPSRSGRRIGWRFRSRLSAAVLLVPRRALGRGRRPRPPAPTSTPAWPDAQSGGGQRTPPPPPGAWPGGRPRVSAPLIYSGNSQLPWSKKNSSPVVLKWPVCRTVSTTPAPGLTMFKYAVKVPWAEPC